MVSLRSLLLVAVLAAAVAPPAPQTAAPPAGCTIPTGSAVGTLGGDFSVNAGGGATYVMELETPPGTHGVGPELSIYYGSQSTEGTLGDGFALQGLSAINRCQASVKLDGYNGGIGFDANDRYCLDGERLVKVAGGGAYGAAGSVYHTAAETWTQVTAVGTCGSGPCSFLAQNKDGWTLQFGVEDSGVRLPGRPEVASWQLSSTTDLNGNRVVVRYRLDSTAMQNLPVEIQYTANAAAGLAATRKIAFDYEPRAHQVPRYIGGQLFRLNQRLRTIRTSVDGAEVMQYRLAYGTSGGTGSDLVCSIQKCNAAGQCFPPTQFTWHQASNRLVSPNSSVTGQIRSGWCRESDALMGWADFNGDGRPDAHCDTPTGTHRVLLSTGTSLISPNASPEGTIRTDWCAGNGLVASWMDFNGDSKADLACDGTDGKHRVLVSNGTAVASPNAATDGLVRSKWCGDSSIVQWGNFNADGRADLLCSSRDGIPRALLSTSTGVASPNSSPDGTLLRAGWCTAAESFTFWGDFNGDHLSDIHCSTSTGLQQVLLSTSTALASPNSDPAGTVARNWCAGADRRRGATDFNGDGLLDSYCSSEGGRHWVMLSTGKSLVSPSTAADGLLRSSWCAGASASTTWSDFNGDGLADLQCSNGKGSLFALLSTGTALKSPDSGADGQLKSGWCSSPGARVVWADFNGDSFDDATCHDAAGSAFALIHEKGASDLVSRITDGIGMTIDVSYLPLTDAAVYTAGDPVRYPTLDVRSPMYVVSRYVNGDGRGNSYPYSYRYRGARTDLEAQRWLGFQEVTAAEESNGRRTVTQYKQEFPVVAFVTASTMQDSSGAVLARTSYTPVVVTPYPNVHQVAVATETSSTFTNGVADYTSVTANRYDAFGNQNFQSVKSAPYYEVYTCHRYDNSIATWRLGYRTASKSARTEQACTDFLAAAEPVWNPAADLRWSRTGYDDRKNALTQGAWDDQNRAWLTVHRTYDAVGNVKSVSDVSGNVTEFTFDETLTFPKSETSPPLPGGRRMTTSYTYYKAFGIAASQTDANGSTQMQRVDGFGRTTELLGPDPSTSSGQATVVLRAFTYGTDATGRYVETRDRLAWNGPDPATWFSSRVYADGMTRVFLQTSRSTRPRADIRTEMLFDASGREWKRAFPHYSDTAADFTVTLYDLLNRPTTVTTPDGTISRTEYLRGAIEVRTTEAYGTDQARVTVDTTDPRDLLVRTVAPNGGISTSTYDAVSQRTSDLGPTGAASTATYDSLGRLIRNVDADTGTNTWTYGTDGMLRVAKDGAGNTVTLAYDVLNRVTKRTIVPASGTTAVYTYVYDDPAHANGLGNLTAAMGPGFTEEYSYSRYDLITLEKLTVGQDVYLDRAGYDPQGRQDKRTFADGSVLRTTRYIDGSLDSVDMQNGGTGAFVNYGKYTAYTALGQPQNLRYGNGLEGATAYYPVATGLSRLKTSSLRKAGAPAALVSAAYEWNRNNGITRIDRTRGSEPAATQTFTHDRMGFLTGASGPLGNLSYEYDLAGNITKKDGVEYHYVPATNRLRDASNGATFAYDGAGNLSQKKAAASDWRFQHDGAGRLASVLLNDAVVGRHLYDSDDQRIERVDASGNVSRYIAEDLDTFQSGNSVLMTKYVRGTTGVIATVTTSYTPQTLKAMLAGQRARREPELYDRQSLRGLGAWTAATARGLFFRIAQHAVTLMAAAIALMLFTAMLLLRATPWVRRHPAFTAFVPFLIAGLVLLGGSEARADLGPGNGYPTAGTLYFHGDQIDSTILVTDPSGAETTRLAYDPFARLDTAGSSGPNNFRPKFSGKEYDFGSDLYYFSARYYDPITARFLEPDPQGQFSSPYLYAGNSPVDMVDPDGELADLLVAVIIAAVVGAVLGAYFGGVAVNDSYDPFLWDWGSGRTLAGVFAGAAIGAAGGALGALGGEAGVATGIIAEVIIGAGENAAFTALAGGSQKEILEAALMGGVLGGASGGLSAAFGRAASRGSRMARRAETEVLEEGGGLTDSAMRNLPCSSFPAGTLVAGGNGALTPIESIVPGNLVLGQVDENGAPPLFPVLSLLARQATRFVDISVGGETVAATPEHAFWVDGRGWTDAAALEPGDRLLTADGEHIAIDAVQPRTAVANVFNFEVGQAHTYFVSPLRLLVHNQLSCMLSKLPPQRSMTTARQKKLWQNKLDSLVKEFGDRIVEYNDPPTGRREINFEAYAYEEAGRKAVVSLKKVGKGSTRPQHFSFADKTYGLKLSRKFKRNAVMLWKVKSRKVKSPGTWHHHPWEDTMAFVPRDIHERIGHTARFETRYRE